MPKSPRARRRRYPAFRRLNLGRTLVFFVSQQRDRVGDGPMAPLSYHPVPSLVTNRTRDRRDVQTHAFHSVSALVDLLLGGG